MSKELRSTHFKEAPNDRKWKLVNCGLLKVHKCTVKVKNKNDKIAEAVNSSFKILIEISHLYFNKL